MARKHAKIRQEYKKVQHQIPLMDMFLQFQAEAATERMRQLGQLVEDVAD